MVHQGVVRHGVLCWMVDLYYMSDVEYYTSESMAWTQADSTQSSGDLEDSTRHGSLDY